MTLNNRDQALLWVLVALLATSAGWFLWLSPTASSLSAVHADVSRLEAERLRLTARLTYLDSAARDIIARPDDLRLVTLAAPADGGMDELVASLDAMAISAGVSLTSIQPQATTDQPTALTLSLGVTGTYPAVRTFISALEQNERPLTIHSLSLSHNSTFEGSTLITGTLTVSALQLASVVGSTQ